MKRTKAPASTSPSTGPKAQVSAIPSDETNQTPRSAETSPVPLALSYDAPGPRPRTDSTRKTELKRSDVPAILFETDDVPNVRSADAPRKFSTGSSPGAPAAAEAPQSLPESYGTGRLLLAARDPKSLYAHWDLTPEQQQRYSDLSDRKHLTLRVHEENIEGQVVSELAVPSRAHHSFITVEAPRARRFVAELGYYPGSGSWQTVATAETAAAAVPYLGTEQAIQFATVQFTPETKPDTSSILLSHQPKPVVELVAGEGFPLPRPLSRSNAAGFPQEISVPADSVQTITVRGQPAFGPESLGDVEDILAEEFEAVDGASDGQFITQLAGSWTPAQESALAELIGWSAVHVRSYASADVLDVVGGAGQGRVARPGEWVNPGEPELSSAGMVEAPDHSAHGFWFNVNAELVIYGATEPGAAVTLGDRPIQLRPDGSFSCRFSLPDGAYPLELNACSSRGETREARLRISRKTEYSSGTGVHPLDSALQPPSPG
jgi:hypothetical protein